MLTRIKQFLHQQKLKKFRSTNLHLVGDGHFDNIRSVGVVFNASTSGHEKPVLRLRDELKREGIDVQVLGYFDSKEEPDSQPFSYFTAENVGMAMTPTSDVAKQFVQQKFDVLINLDLDRMAPLNYVCAASHALFKVGLASSNQNHYDLMIDMGDNVSMKDLIREIRSTLNLIR